MSDGQPKEIALRAPESRDVLVLPDKDTLLRKLQAVSDFQKLVHANLVEGHDYGVIPGTGNKPVLLLPGAEKLTKLMELADSYEIVQSIEDWDRPLFRYLIRCRLTLMGTDTLISEGVGECNSMESKYRWRNAERVCPNCGAVVRKSKQGDGFYCWEKTGGCGATFRGNDPEIINQPLGKVANDDVYSLVNTILKMARKRAFVGASLSAGRLSDIFTQDLEDAVIEGVARDLGSEPRQEPPARQQATPRPASAPRQQAAPARQESASPSMGAPVTSDADPLWVEWLKLVAVADREGVRYSKLGIPTGRSPIPAIALTNATNALRAALHDALGDLTEDDDPQGAMFESPPSPAEAIPFA